MNFDYLGHRLQPGILSATTRSIQRHSPIAGHHVAPANVNDHFLLKETLEAIVVKRPRPTEKEPQHLCLDAGYDNQMSRETVNEHHYQRLSKSLISALVNLSPGIVVTRRPLGPTFSPNDLANIRADHEQLGDQILGK